MRGGRIVAHLPISTLGLSIESARIIDDCAHDWGSTRRDSLSLTEREENNSNFV